MSLIIGNGGARRRWVENLLPRVSMETHMPHYTPSTRIIGSSLLIRGEPPSLVCPSCGDTMRVSGTIPKVGVRPEQLVFLCPSCKEVAAKRYLWRDILKMRRERAGHSVKTNQAPLPVTATNANANHAPTTHAVNPLPTKASMTTVFKRSSICLSPK